jgi:hypothetical protein
MTIRRPSPLSTVAAVTTISLSPNAQVNVVVGLPPTIDLRLYQGDHFTLELSVLDTMGNQVNFAGSVFTSQIRSSPNDPTLLSTFAVSTMSNVVMLTLDHNSSNFWGSAVWDVQWEDPNAVYRTLARGSIEMTASVTSTPGGGGGGGAAGTYGSGVYNSGDYGG